MTGLQQFIQENFQEKRDETNRVVYRAFIGAEHLIPMPSGFARKAEWCTGGRTLWVSTLYCAILGYVEGDLFLEAYKTPQAFTAGCARAAEFYSNY